MCAAAPHSGLMFAVRITLAHFSVSSAMSLPKSAGEPASTVPSRSASRALNLGSASAALISLLSLSTISAGVFLGAPRPKHRACFVAGDELAHRRDVRQRFRAHRRGYRERAQRAGPDVLDRWCRVSKDDLHLPAEQIGERGRHAAIGHVQDVEAGHLLNNSPVMWVIRRCRPSHVELARIGLGIGDELGKRLGRNRRVHHHDKGHPDQARDRCDVVDEIEIEFVVKRRIDRVRRTDQEERVAVRQPRARPPRWRYCCRRPAGSR